MIPLLYLAAAAALLRAPPASVDPPRRPMFTIPAGVSAEADAPVDFETDLPSKVTHEASGIGLVLIPAGEFRMGEDAVLRRVVRPFYLGETEVTADQFRRFADMTGYTTDAERGTPDQTHTVGSFAATAEGDREWNVGASWRRPWPNLATAGQAVREDLPVVHVSWNDASAFCVHFGLALPSECQWEYACCAGDTARFPWGDDPAGGAAYANVKDSSYARRFPAPGRTFPFDDGEGMLAREGSKRPNAWGLHDMIGSVEEWTADARGPLRTTEGDHERASTADNGRVVRGGAWLSSSEIANCTSRSGLAQHARRDHVGFRVVMNVP